jgi:SOS-response transcriptional repressor LexA
MATAVGTAIPSWREQPVPRHNHSKAQRRSTSSSAPERSGGSRRRQASGDTDAQALTLREAGNSFSAIARTLGFERATEAHRSYIRALDTSEGEERRRLVKNEEARLEQLEQRIRERDAKDVPKMERRLQGVGKLREAMPK